MDQQLNEEEGSAKAQHRDLINVNALNSNRVESLQIAIAQIILEKLPFPCLFRCKFLSKSFSRTMNNMSFSHKDPFLYFKFQNSLYYVRLDSANHQISEHKIVYKPIQVNNQLSNLYIVGSCNGYLCLSATSSSSPSSIPNGENITLIFNPFMPRDIKNLPPTSMELSWASGFGFNQKTDENKVVRIYYAIDDNCFKQHVQISNMGTNHWRTLNTPYGILIRSRTATCARGVYLNNGCIYWLGERQLKKSLVIVELNLDKEEVKEIAPPDDETILKGCDFYLVKRRGQLVLVAAKYSKFELQIWVMEYQFSWRELEFVKLKVIDELLKDEDRDTYLRGLYNKTLYDVIWLQHDNLLLQFEKGILCYDLTRKRFIDFKVEGLPNLGGNQKEFEAVVDNGSVLGIERCT